MKSFPIGMLYSTLASLKSKKFKKYGNLIVHDAHTLKCMDLLKNNRYTNGVAIGMPYSTQASLKSNKFKNMSI